MDSNLLNISKVESFFKNLLYNNLSKNVFFSALPSAIKSTWEDIVLVDIDITDNGVGQGFANIFLYTKPIGGCRKNVKKLSEMETKLNGIIESSNDINYHITRYKTYSDYDSSRNLFYTIVSLRVNII